MSERTEAVDGVGGPSPTDPPGPAPGSFVARLAQARARAEGALEAARDRSGPVDAAFSILLRPRLVANTVLAGYLALRLFILAFPLAYTVVAGLGLYSREANGSPEEVASQAGLAPAVSASIVEAAETSSRGHWVAFVIGLGATLWAARGVLRALRGLHALSWRVPTPKTGVEVVGPLVTALGVVALVLTGTTTERLREGAVGLFAANLLGLAAMAAIWLLATWWLPHAAVRWYELVPGALLFAVGVQLLHLATALYFLPKASSTSAAYGVLGVGLVVLSWLVALGWVVILAAELDSGLHGWRHRADGATSPMATMEEEPA